MGCCKSKEVRERAITIEEVRKKNAEDICLKVYQQSRQGFLLPAWNNPNNNVSKKEEKCLIKERIRTKNQEDKKTKRKLAQEKKQEMDKTIDADRMKKNGKVLDKSIEIEKVVVEENRTDGTIERVDTELEVNDQVASIENNQLPRHRISPFCHCCMYNGEDIEELQICSPPQKYPNPQCSSITALLCGYEKDGHIDS